MALSPSIPTYDDDRFTGKRQVEQYQRLNIIESLDRYPDYLGAYDIVDEGDETVIFEGSLDVPGSGEFNEFNKLVQTGVSYVTFVGDADFGVFVFNWQDSTKARIYRVHRNFVSGSQELQYTFGINTIVIDCDAHFPTSRLLILIQDTDTLVYTMYNMVYDGSNPVSINNQHTASDLRDVTQIDDAGRYAAIDSSGSVKFFNVNGTVKNTLVSVGDIHIQGTVDTIESIGLDSALPRGLIVSLTYTNGEDTVSRYLKPVNDFIFDTTINLDFHYKRIRPWYDQDDAFLARLTIISEYVQCHDLSGFFYGSCFSGVDEDFINLTGNSLLHFAVMGTKKIHVWDHEVRPITDWWLELGDHTHPPGQPTSYRHLLGPIIYGLGQLDAQYEYSWFRASHFELKDAQDAIEDLLPLFEEFVSEGPYVGVPYTTTTNPNNFWFRVFGDRYDWKYPATEGERITHAAYEELEACVDHLDPFDVTFPRGLAIGWHFKFEEQVF